VSDRPGLSAAVNAVEERTVGLTDEATMAQVMETHQATG
jgi:hypothetical protein